MCLCGFCGQDTKLSQNVSKCQVLSLWDRPGVWLDLSGYFKTQWFGGEESTKGPSVLHVLHVLQPGCRVLTETYSLVSGVTEG